jgi:hypothetical protein
MKTQLILTLGLCFLARPVRADDWPQWRGPQRDGTSQETGLLKEWPPGSPKLLWKTTDLGNGYSSFSVLGEHLYTLGNETPDNEFVQARSVNDGRRLWQTRLGNVGTNIPQANYAAARSRPPLTVNIFMRLVRTATSPRSRGRTANRGGTKTCGPISRANRALGLRRVSAHRWRRTHLPARWVRGYSRRSQQEHGRHSLEMRLARGR